MQRVRKAKVEVDDQVVGQIDQGLLVLVGVAVDDTSQDVKYLADKLSGLRVFEDEQGKMNCSIQDISGAMLVVSQFTLMGDCRKGRRPSFIGAARPELGKELYLQLVESLRIAGLRIETGIFQADMQVTLTNDGPVTLLLDSRKGF